MNKLFYLIVLILSISIVSATDKFITSIPDCYNVSIDCKLELGSRVDLSFKDCSKVDNMFFCDCRDKKPFNLYLQNDGSGLNYNETRVYDCEIDYATYSLSFFNQSLLFFDRGNGWNVQNSTLEGMGENVVYVPKVVYGGERIIEKNVSVERIVYINQTFYFENKSKIDEMTLTIQKLNMTLNYSWKIADKYQRSAYNWRLTAVIFIVLFLALLIAVLLSEYNDSQK